MILPVLLSLQNLGGMENFIPNCISRGLSFVIISISMNLRLDAIVDRIRSLATNVVDSAVPPVPPRHYPPRL